MKNSKDIHTLDQIVRRYVYGHFVEQERPPTVTETADALTVSMATVEASYQRLHEEHVVVLESDHTTIRFALPFCATPTPFRVHAKGHAWWATCAWDALGVPAALHTDAEIVSTCPDCETQIVLNVKNGALLGANKVIHFAIPAKNWWDNIFFT